MDKQPEIELYINSWLSDSGELFDFNTNGIDESSSFQGIIGTIPIPKHTSSHHYYFVHQKITKNDKKDFLLERRMNLISHFDFQEENIKAYKLIGGFQIFKKETNNKTVIYMKPIQASKIKVYQQQSEQRQKVDKKKPYLIVRSFKQGCNVKIGQRIKFGKLEMEVVDQNTAPDESDKIMDLDVSSVRAYTSTSQGTSQKDGDRQCRICYETSENQQQEDILVHICDCKGSGGYTHISCLKSWLNMRLSRFQSSEHQGKVYHTNLFYCEICKKAYPKALRIKDRIFNLLPYMKEDMPFICLKNVSTTSEEQYNAYVTIPTGEIATVGRLEENSMILVQNSVSRKHAYFEAGQDSFKIYDKKSKFGTLLWEENVQVRLHRYSTVAMEIGNTIFAFKVKVK